MEAFKKHSLDNLNDLSVELKFNYVHIDLIPRLMVKRRHKDACLFDDSGNNRGHDGVVGGTTSNEVVTPATSDAFLQS